MRLKKILLVSLLLILVSLPFVGNLQAVGSSCGCDDYYQGAALVGEICLFTMEGVMTYRHCFYEY